MAAAVEEDAWADRSRNGEAVLRALRWFRESDFGNARCRVAAPRTLPALTEALRPHCVFTETALPQDVLEWLRCAGIVTIDRSEPGAFRPAGRGKGGEVFYDVAAARRTVPPPLVVEGEELAPEEDTGGDSGGVRKRRAKGNSAVPNYVIEQRALTQAKRAALSFVLSRELEPELLPGTYHELIHALTRFCDMEFSIPAQGVADALVRKGFVYVDANGVLHFDQPKLQDHFDFARADEAQRGKARVALFAVMFFALLGPLLLAMWRRFRA
jgi:hypothetical protein